MALSPSTSIVSATYCVTRYPLSLRSESSTASDGGKLRVGPVGSPSLRAVAVSRVRPCPAESDRKSTRLNSSHGYISYAVFCLKKKKTNNNEHNSYAAPTLLC